MRVPGPAIGEREVAHICLPWLERTVVSSFLLFAASGSLKSKFKFLGRPLSILKILDLFTFVYAVLVKTRGRISFEPTFALKALRFSFFSPLLTETGPSSLKMEATIQWDSANR